MLRTLYLLCLACIALPAIAQTDETPQRPDWLNKVIETGANQEIVELHLAKLETLHRSISALEAKANDTSSSLTEFRSAIQQLAVARSELRAFAESLRPKLADVGARLSKLGPPPKKGESEAEDLARQRQELSNRVSAYDGLVKRAEVLVVQADQAAATFNATRRKAFYSQLLKRSEGFSEISYWTDAVRAAPAQTSQAFKALTKWVRDSVSSNWLVVSIAVLVAGVVGITLRRLFFRLLRSEQGRSGSATPGRAERGAMALRRSISVAAPAAGLLLVLILIGSSFGVLVQWELQFATRVATYLSVSIFLWAALYFALCPKHPADSLLEVRRSAAIKVFWVLATLVLAWFADQVLAQMDLGLSSPIALIVLRSVVAAVVYGILLGGLLLIFLDRPNAPPISAQTNGWPRPIFGIIALAALFIVCAAALGYVSLARFVGGQLIVSGGLIFVVLLVHLTAEFVSSPKTVRSTHPDGKEAQTVVGATLGVVFGLALDLLVLLVGVPLLLLQWGYEWSEVRGWLMAALLGFQIGDLRLSLLAIFISVAILIAGFLLTRIVRTMFLRRSEYLFADGSGVRDSISTVLTYIGFVLSVVAALSYLGVGVTNIALIAGALSVGIGFGLQSIANNFVSGLILLAERPMKVGDWIVVGDREGRVQKISVRSTQIRTFDRSTVIVPNADLITGQVVNWDHGDPVGRVVIAVGVAYGTNPRTVIKILDEIGRSNRHTIVHDTSPVVVFEGFGDSSLDFTLRVHIRNMRNFLEVQTDIRVEIVEAFAREGIEIPFPQRDIHFKPSELTSGVMDPDAKAAE